MTAALAWIARHGRFVLLGGLFLGIGLPDLARVARPTIVPLLAILLFLAALRIGPDAARPRRAELRRALGMTLLLQTVAPLAAIAVIEAGGWTSYPIALGVVLVLAGPPIVGAPGLAVLSGANPAPALRQLVLGTALLPLTVLPVFWLMGVFPDLLATLAGVGRLVAIIAIACGCGFLLHAAVPALARPQALATIDGITTLAFASVVIGLMGKVGPALLSGEGRFWAILLLVLALNFGLQAGAWRTLRHAVAGRDAAAFAIVAGNRNLALFLAALPPGTGDALLLFVGCFQIPIYLTPLVMARFYRSGLGPAS